VLWFHGTVFSVHLSDNGQDFSEVGRITTGDGDADSFWWRSTTARYFRLMVHEASASEGAVVDELKLRILNKDRMPIGALERAAAAGRGELYPQSLLGRQIYWTALGEFDAAEEVRSIKRTASTLRPFGRGNSTERGFRPFRGATQSRSAEAALAFLNSFAARASLRSTGPSISRGSGIGGIASFWHLRATATDMRRTPSSAERSRAS
jgi:hypothetical protein